MAVMELKVSLEDFQNCRADDQPTRLLRSERTSNSASFESETGLSVSCNIPASVV
jgi:hypothetical protein